MVTTRGSDAILRALVVVAAVVVIVAGLRAAAALLMPLAIAAFLAITVHPIVSWLERHRLPTWSAVMVTLVALLLALLGPGLVVQNAAVRFVAVAPGYGARLATITSGWFEWLQAQGVDPSEVPDVLNWTGVLNLAGELFANAALLLSNAFLVLLVVAFVLMEAAGLPDTLGRAFRLDPAALDRFQRVTGEVQRYLRVKTAVSLATGLVVWLWTAALGVEFAVLWGLLAFLLNYIPNFGSILAAIPPVLLSVVQGGIGLAVIVAIGFGIVNMVLGNIVEPYVMGRRLRMSPLVIVLSLVFWGWLWGSIGMVLAVPIMMVMRILLEESAELKWVAVLIAGNGRPVAEPVSSPATRASTGAAELGAPRHRASTNARASRSDEP